MNLSVCNKDSEAAINAHVTLFSNMADRLNAEAFLKAIAPEEIEFTFHTFVDSKEGAARAIMGGNGHRRLFLCS
jgi:hypothetical protein